MMLRDATPQEIDEVLGQTHALWSDGLDLSSYRDFISTLIASEWARQDPGNYRFLALVDAPQGTVLSAMKLYRFRARLDDEMISVGGIGAVFTPPDRRRRGHAAEMIERAHTVMRERGDQISLLYSEIGAAYYAKLGYRAMPAHAVRIPVPAAGRSSAGAAAGGLKRMHRDELDRVVRLREREDAGAGFALVRDRVYWKYLLARASYPTVWLGRERWESRLVTAGERGYLWSLFGQTHEGSGAKLLEFGEAEPGAALPALLDECFEECRRRGAAAIDTWLPPAQAARDARLGVSHAAAPESPPAVPMWFPLDPVAGADMQRHESAALLHLTDLF